MVESMVQNIRNADLTKTEQRRQLDALERLNQLHLKQRESDSALNAQIKTMETAFQMQAEACDVAHDIDPAFDRALRAALAAGVSSPAARPTRTSPMTCSDPGLKRTAKRSR